MLDTLFGDSGYLKYYEDNTNFNYSYSINTTDYPTMHSHVDYWEFCIITEGTIKNRIEGKRAEIYPKKRFLLCLQAINTLIINLTPRSLY